MEKRGKGTSKEAELHFLNRNFKILRCTQQFTMPKTFLKEQKYLIVPFPFIR